MKKLSISINERRGYDQKDKVVPDNIMPAINKQKNPKTQNPKPKQTLEGKTIMSHLTRNALWVSGA